jgi:hypothetical protein
MPQYGWVRVEIFGHKVRDDVAALVGVLGELSVYGFSKDVQCIESLSLKQSHGRSKPALCLGE